MKISAKKVVSYVKPQLSVKSAFGALTGSSLAAEALARVGGQLKKKMFGHQRPVAVEPIWNPQVLFASDADRDARIGKLSDLAGQHGFDASHLKQIKDDKFWCYGLPKFELAIGTYHQADKEFRELSQSEHPNFFAVNKARKDRESRRTAMEQEFKQLAQYFDGCGSVEAQSSLIQQHEAACAKLPSKDSVGRADGQKSAVSVSSKPVSSQPVGPVAPQSTKVDADDALDEWAEQFLAQLENS